MAVEEKYICYGVDVPLPDWQRFEQEKLTTWQREHPTIRTFEHSVVVRTTREMINQRPYTFRMILINITYQAEGARP